MLITGFLDIPHGFIDYSGPYLLSRGNFVILTCFRMVPGSLGGPKITSKSTKIGENCHFFNVCRLITGFWEILHGFYWEWFLHFCLMAFWYFSRSLKCSGGLISWVWEILHIMGFNSNLPWKPHWITNGEVHKTVRELAIKWQCQWAAGCVRWKCYNVDMRCIMLCHCNCNNCMVYDN